MTQQRQYAIGTPGSPWGDAEKAQWLSNQTIKRSYQQEVLSKLEPLKAELDIEQYGRLPYDMGDYPLFVIKTRDWDDSKPTVLVTGGVHGYETSGVQGAIRFAATKANDYKLHFNVVVAPCLSPWGYETINRWNPATVDPNRSFVTDSPAPESALLMAWIKALNVDIVAHIDLHETTDTDNSEFRPAKAARDGTFNDNWNIPDGFYLVGDTNKPEPEFQKAMIAAVELVTHIAPPDENGNIIGEALQQHGVINYATKALGLCAGLTDAPFVTTTEVYPDSPKSDDENCILAQVAAVTSGLDYVIAQLSG